MRLQYVVVGVFALLFGITMVVWPETVARWRNSGAVNADPTPGLVKLTRYVGGPALLILGVILVTGGL